MVVRFTAIYAISAYHHWCCEFKSRTVSRCTKLCDKVCKWLATGQWFSPGPSVSSTNKTDRHDITEILLKLALNTFKQTNKQYFSETYFYSVALIDFTFTIKSVSTVSSFTCTDKATISVVTGSILITGSRCTFINIYKEMLWKWI
jgi:hypothetical protein